MKEPIKQMSKSKMMFNNINIVNGRKGSSAWTNTRTKIKIDKCSSTFFWYYKCGQAPSSLIKVIKKWCFNSKPRY